MGSIDSSSNTIQPQKEKILLVDEKASSTPQSELTTDQKITKIVGSESKPWRTISEFFSDIWHGTSTYVAVKLTTDQKNLYVKAENLAQALNVSKKFLSGTSSDRLGQLIEMFNKDNKFQQVFNSRVTPQKNNDTPVPNGISPLPQKHIETVVKESPAVPAAFKKEGDKEVVSDDVPTSPLNERVSDEAIAAPPLEPQKIEEAPPTQFTVLSFIQNDVKFGAIKKIADTSQKTLVTVKPTINLSKLVVQKETPPLALSTTNRVTPQIKVERSAAKIMQGLISNKIFKEDHIPEPYKIADLNGPFEILDKEGVMTPELYKSLSRLPKELVLGALIEISKRIAEHKSDKDFKATDQAAFVLETLQTILDKKLISGGQLALKWGHVKNDLNKMDAAIKKMDQNTLTRLSKLPEPKKSNTFLAIVDRLAKGKDEYVQGNNNRASFIVLQGKPNIVLGGPNEPDSRFNKILQSIPPQDIVDNYPKIMQGLQALMGHADENIAELNKLEKTSLLKTIISIGEKSSTLAKNTYEYTSGGNNRSSYALINGKIYIPNPKSQALLDQLYNRKWITPLQMFDKTQQSQIETLMNKFSHLTEDQLNNFTNELSKINKSKVLNTLWEIGKKIGPGATKDNVYVKGDQNQATFAIHQGIPYIPSTNVEAILNLLSDKSVNPSEVFKNKERIEKNFIGLSKIPEPPGLKNLIKVIHQPALALNVLIRFGEHLSKFPEIQKLPKTELEKLIRAFEYVSNGQLKNLSLLASPQRKDLILNTLLSLGKKLALVQEKMKKGEASEDVIKSKSSEHTDYSITTKDGKIQVKVGEKENAERIEKTVKSFKAQKLISSKAEKADQAIKLAEALKYVKVSEGQVKMLSELESSAGKSLVIGSLLSISSHLDPKNPNKKVVVPEGEQNLAYTINENGSVQIGKELLSKDLVAALLKKDPKEKLTNKTVEANLAKLGILDSGKIKDLSLFAKKSRREFILNTFTAIGEQIKQFKLESGTADIFVEGDATKRGFLVTDEDVYIKGNLIGKGSFKEVSEGVGMNTDEKLVLATIKGEKAKPKEVSKSSESPKPSASVETESEPADDEGGSSQLINEVSVGDVSAAEASANERNVSQKTTEPLIKIPESQNRLSEEINDAMKESKLLELLHNADPKVTNITPQYLVKVLQADGTTGKQKLVMLQMKVGQLEQIVKTIGPDNSKRNVNEMLQIGYGVAVGLAGLHRVGIVHCDMKPANILFDDVKGKKIGLVHDFGTAVNNEEAVAGLTKEYAPFEAVEISPNGPPVLKACIAKPSFDSFSFGVTLLEMLTGKIKKGGKVLSQLTQEELNAFIDSLKIDSTIPAQDRQKISQALDICKELLKKKPEERMTCQVASERLKALL